MVWLNLFLSLITLLSCNNSDELPDNGKKQSQEPVTFTINAADRQQTITGFGASDAWSIQFVGKNWPLDKRKKIADLLFSKDVKSDGSPGGIGLSIWRFNFGAGSARQGKNSGISDPWRRAESFLSADSSYDWSKQSGQQWFLQAAQERGVEQFIGFANSPPVQLTKNGKAYGNGGTHANLSEDDYNDFADYLTHILVHFKHEGIPFDYISPVNEPQWDWAKNNNQEGSPYHNDEIKQIIKALDSSIQANHLETKIEIPEAAQINFLYDGNRDGRDHQIQSFFGPNSGINSVKSLAHKVAAHSYFTTWPTDKMIQQRQELWQIIQQTDPSLQYWMSEYCILANNEEIKGGGRNLGIDPALYVARLIHYDLTVAHASSWQWWLAVSPYDFKDGLVYIDKNQQNGRVYDSKMLWALGNYSRFIRPGAVRVGVSRSDDKSPVQNINGLMSSAYLDQQNNQVIIVAVNYSKNDKKISFKLKGLDNDQAVAKLTPYVTSADKSLEAGPQVTTDGALTVSARSITTFVGSLN